MLETELYNPVKDYLEKHGYRVRAEVKNCDVVATKGEELIVVELKTSANMTLLIQATERQSISDSVYVAIPKPKNQTRQWRGIKRVIKRLELGLLVIDESPMGMSVTKHFDPLPYQRRKNSSKKKAVLKEVAERWLPRDIINRPKASFTMPLRAWIKSDLRDVVDDFVLSDHGLAGRGLFDVDILRNIVEADRNGRADNAQHAHQPPGYSHRKCSSICHSDY